MGTFRLAFFSDPHLGPLPALRWRDIVSKRVTGFANWRVARRSRYDMAGLARLQADIQAAQADHYACGGDLANLGLPEEFAKARLFLERLSPPQRLSLAPGNHCLYMADSLAPMMAALGPWMTGDGERQPAFPYLRRRGMVALLALNSAAPTRPFDATGLLGEAQIEAAFLLLTALKTQNVCRIIIVHHPPHVGGAPRGRCLRDAAAFEAMLAQAGAELVLHGHNHVTSVAHRLGANALTPILGVGSAAERNSARGRRPVWLRIDIAPGAENDWTIDVAERGLNEHDEIVERAISLAP